MVIEVQGWDQHTRPHKGMVHVLRGEWYWDTYGCE